MFPKWTRLDVVDEAYSAEVEVLGSFSGHDRWVDDICWGGGFWRGAFCGCGLLGGSEGGTILGAAEDVR